MFETATVLAHAGEEVFYVLAPLAVLFVGWLIWERLRGALSGDEDESDKDDSVEDDDATRGHD